MTPSIHPYEFVLPACPTTADERVQLERLRDVLLGSDGQPRPGVVHSKALYEPLPLGLTSSEQQLLEAYAARVAAWGWRWRLPPPRPGGACDAGVPLLTHVPQLWGASLSATDLKLYLHHLGDTSGGGGLPAAVVRTLNSKACRGAIMFGDLLDPAQVGVGGALGVRRVMAAGAGLAPSGSNALNRVP